MTDTTELTEMIDPVTGEIIDQKGLAELLLAQAKEQGISLVGPGGLLSDEAGAGDCPGSRADRIPGP